MATLTTTNGIPYPASSETPDVPRDILALATWLNPKYAAWTAYTPGWTASTTNPVIGNGSITGAYLQVGKLVHFRLKVACGSTTTFGTGSYYFGLPLNAHAAYAINDVLAGAGHILAGSHYGVIPLIVNAGAVALLSGTSYASPTIPGTMVAASTITISGTYEAA